MKKKFFLSFQAGIFSIISNTKAMGKTESGKEAENVLRIRETQRPIWIGV